MSSPGQELDCERLPDCAAYVLWALDEREAEIHDAHLTECPTCRAEVLQLQLVADSLAVGVSRARAHQSLRARIVGTAYAEAELRGASRRQEPGSATFGRLGGLSVAWTRRLVPALAGALVLGVGLAAGALAFKSKPSEKTEVIRAIVAAPGHRATAELRKVGAQLELVVVRMPAPPPGRIYEVWLQRGTEAPEPTDALFSVTKTGSGSVGVPGNLRGVNKVLVTDEPLGGSPKPTRTPVIVGSI